MVKEERGRQAEGRSGQPGTEEEGGGEGVEEGEEGEKGETERRGRAGESERASECTDRGSLALSIHMPSHQMVCSHPGDVATKRTPLPSNHCYRQ